MENNEEVVQEAQVVEEQAERNRDNREVQESMSKSKYLGYAVLALVFLAIVFGLLSQDGKSEQTAEVKPKLPPQGKMANKPEPKAAPAAKDGKNVFNNDAFYREAKPDGNNPFAAKNANKPVMSATPEAKEMPKHPDKEQVAQALKEVPAPAAPADANKPHVGDHIGKGIVTHEAKPHDPGIATEDELQQMRETENILKKGVQLALDQETMLEERNSDFEKRITELEQQIKYLEEILVGIDSLDEDSVATKGGIEEVNRLIGAANAQLTEQGERLTNLENAYQALSKDLQEAANKPAANNETSAVVNELSERIGDLESAYSALIEQMRAAHDYYGQGYRDSRDNRYNRGYDDRGYNGNRNYDERNYYQGGYAR